jgi:hypothetical protein
MLRERKRERRRRRRRRDKKKGGTGCEAIPLLTCPHAEQSASRLEREASAPPFCAPAFPKGL